jgi:hypothetical protein
MVRFSFFRRFWIISALAPPITASGFVSLLRENARLHISGTPLAIPSSCWLRPFANVE